MKKYLWLLILLCPFLVSAAIQPQHLRIISQYNAATAAVGNDFSGDANCVAVWNFEDGALTTDSKGGNTLTNVNTVTSDQVNYKQGAASANFEQDDNEYFTITDANLDAGFPLKNGDTTKIISVTFWIRFSSFPADDQHPFSKTATGVHSLTLWLSNGSQLLKWWLGYNGGADREYNASSLTVTTGVWYHVGFTYDDADKGFRMRVWDDTAQDQLGADWTGTTTNNINIETAALTIGGAFDSDCIDGNIDELVVFKDELTPAQIDQIRSGTYGS